MTSPLNGTGAGRLYGVGLGPGDPNLMTLRAVRAIGEADVVAYHSARHGRSIARSIAAEHLRSDHIEEPLVYPVTTETTDHPGGYRGALEEFYEKAAPASRRTWTPGGPSRSSPRATRCSTARTCTCTSGWPTGTPPRSSRA